MGGWDQNETPGNPPSANGSFIKNGKIQPKGVQNRFNNTKGSNAMNATPVVDQSS